jgi:hypothetical protein
MQTHARTHGNLSPYISSHNDSSLLSIRAQSISTNVPIIFHYPNVQQCASFILVFHVRLSLFHADWVAIVIFAFGVLVLSFSVVQRMRMLLPYVRNFRTRFSSLTLHFYLLYHSGLKPWIGMIRNRLNNPHCLHTIIILTIYSHVMDISSSWRAYSFLIYLRAPNSLCDMSVFASE